MALYILAGAAAGIAAGFLLPLTIPVRWMAYSAVLLLAVFSALVGAWRAETVNSFQTNRFLLGLAVNGMLAIALTALGERLNAPIYLAAVVYFGYRIMDNCNRIAVHYIAKKVPNGASTD